MSAFFGLYSLKFTDENMLQHCEKQLHHHKACKHGSSFDSASLVKFFVLEVQTAIPGRVIFCSTFCKTMPLSKKSLSFSLIVSS